MACFPLRVGTREGCRLTPLIQHSTESSSLHNKARKGNKRHTDYKGRTKTAHIHRQHDIYVEDPKESTKKSPRTNKWAQQIKGYKINTQKLIAFLYANNDVNTVRCQFSSD